MARETMYGDTMGQGSDPTGKYTINRGDNLTKIAMKQLGPGASQSDIQTMVQKIAKENNIADVNRIQAGAQLKLPPNANMGPAPGSAPVPPPSGAPPGLGPNSEYGKMVSAPLPDFASGMPGGASPSPTSNIVPPPPQATRPYAPEDVVDPMTFNPRTGQNNSLEPLNNPDMQRALRMNSMPPGAQMPQNLPRDIMSFGSAATGNTQYAPAFGQYAGQVPLPAQSPTAVGGLSYGPPEAVDMIKAPPVPFRKVQYSSKKSKKSGSKRR
jgi:hypothetical protein